MSRAVVVTGVLLIALGLGVFAIKTVGYGLPISPADTRGLWQVELRITVRGDGRQGSVSAFLPSPVEGQVVLDESSTSDRLQFSIRKRDDSRIGLWQGRLDGVHEIFYRFRVQIQGVKMTLPSGAVPPPPADVAKSYAGDSHEFPASAPEVRDLVDRLALQPTDGPVDRARKLFAFVTHEVATTPSAGADALLTLAQREGNETGKARLLVAVLRAAGVPARLVHGLQLRELAAPKERVWCEAWLGGWFPMSPADGSFAERPANFVPLGSEPRDLVEATGAQALGYRFRSLQERLRPEEVALLMEPDNPVLAALSLYKLPVGTQSALRALLLFPLGALIVAVARNLVGVPTYGTFMPLLVAFALRGYPLAPGLALVAFVLMLGVVTRLALERLRLLMVPRLSILLCVVVLSVAALSRIGDAFGVREFFAGVLFPIVILTMLVERFTIAIAEEGVRSALMPLLGSLAVAVAIHPVFRNVWAEHVLFTFPELVFVLMGLLVFMGGYTGYRISDVWRFRMLATGEAAG